jgi:hypothetical protein
MEIRGKLTSTVGYAAMFEQVYPADLRRHIIPKLRWPGRG